MTNFVSANKGRYFEDFQVGDVYRNPLGRTLTDVDNIWFTLLTMNSNPMHFDSEYASRSEFGKMLINSGLTVALLLGLTVADLSQHGIANLGWREINLLKPVFAGDTLYAESQVLEVRESSSRPHAGIVTARSRGVNQRGEVCLSWIRSVMVLKRQAESEEIRFPPVTRGIEEEE